MTRVPVYLVSLAVLAWAASGAEKSLTETRSTLEKWVETRQLISKTISDWASDKEMLEQTVQLYERELKAVEDQFVRLGTNTVQVDQKRLQAETLLKASDASLEQARQFAVGFEAHVAKLVPQLPAPLQELLKPMIAGLPSDPANTKMAATDRVRVLVGILNEIDKFNNGVNLFSEKRKNEKGEDVAVDTVYVGLGAAYFVNEAGSFAGSGVPGAQGWEWTIKPELAPSIREAVRIYRNERSARFITLPAVIR